MSNESNEKIRAQILAILRETPNLTSVEVASKMGKPVKQLRPRFTEMKRDGLIAKGEQKKPEGAKRSSHGWTVVANG